MLHTYIKYFFLPPSLILACLLLSLFTWWFRLYSLFWLILATVLLYVLSVPPVAEHLIAPLQHVPVLSTITYEPDAAIVILSGGHIVHAPEFQGLDEANESTLVRLRYGAYLAKRSHLPILVSGGGLFGEPPEAPMMKRVLERDFDVPVKWVEDKSRDTHENAISSLAMLHENKIKKVYLVTSATHMRRALLAFKDKTIEIIPAPTSFCKTSMSNDPLFNWIPRASVLMISSYALYEYGGLIWEWFSAKLS